MTTNQLPGWSADAAAFASEYAKRVYYHAPATWQRIRKTGMDEILPRFGAERLAAAYYDRLYRDGSAIPKSEFN